jgi:hypothetical protein
MIPELAGKLVVLSASIAPRQKGSMDDPCRIGREKHALTSWANSRALVREGPALMLDTRLPRENVWAKD